MDIKSLRYFIATAQFGSITKAAAHLHVAQPAVSRQLRKLEDELGAKLLTRTVQGVVLTGPGEHLLARAEPLLQMLSQTRAEVRNWDAEPSGPVVTETGSLVGRTVADVERHLIIDTLSHCLGNRTHAANILGISIRTLRNKVKQYTDEGFDVPWHPHHGMDILSYIVAYFCLLVKILSHLHRANFSKIFLI